MSTQSTCAQRVDKAISALATGKMIIVTDDVNREDEGDLMVAAELITDEQMTFIVRHSTGIVCTPMPRERADLLKLPPMVEHSTDAHGTAFTVSVDYWDTGTGVSAADRVSTVHALAAAATEPEQLRRPGHIFPLRARDGGVLVRAGHTEAAVDLMRIAGLSGVGVISEIVDEDGSMRRGASLQAFAREHDIPILAIADLVRYRLATEQQIQMIAASTMPTKHGDFQAFAYRDSRDGTEHLALVMGDLATHGAGQDVPLVRVHSECLTGDVLGSVRCDCGAQLEASLQAIAGQGCGALVYLRGHEGRGIGLAHKIRAYALQEQGMDTVDANTAQGFPVDTRSYGVGSQILADLGATRIRLITNNPAKYSGLEGYGITIVGRVSLPVAATPHNIRYLRTKRDRMGHDLDIPQTSNGLS